MNNTLSSSGAAIHDPSDAATVTATDTTANVLSARKRTADELATPATVRYDKYTIQRGTNICATSDGGIDSDADVYEAKRIKTEISISPTKHQFNSAAHGPISPEHTPNLPVSSAVSSIATSALLSGHSTHDAISQRAPSPKRSPSPARAPSPTHAADTSKRSPSLHRMQIDTPVQANAQSENIAPIDKEPLQQNDINLNDVKPIPQLCSSLQKAQLKWATSMLKTLKRHGEAGPFLLPVDPLALGIPDYLNVIKKPMDISTIERNLSAGMYENVAAMVADVELMFNNCFSYNPPSHPVHVMGRNVEKAFVAQLKRIPREGDDLRVETSSRQHSSAASPASARPKREVHAPMREFVGGIDEFSRKNSKKTQDDLRWCGNVWRELMKKQYQPNMFIFYNPVDPVALNIPTYFDVIKEPMDLSTIKKKLDRREYESAEDFEADCRLMFNNCFTFNRPTDDVCLMGKRAEEAFDRKWAERPPAPAFNASAAYGSSFTGASNKKRRSDAHRHSDEDWSSDEEHAGGNSMQIHMIEQQISFLQSQLDTLKHGRKGRRGTKKSHSRRSSKGSLAAGVETATAPRLPKPPKVPKPPKAKKEEVLRDITFEEKKELSESINSLSGDRLGKVVKIIHECMPHLKGENGQDEIELDIDSLDTITLNRLWNFVKGKKRKSGAGPKIGSGDATVDAARINELEREIAMMDGRVDKVQKLSGASATTGGKDEYSGGAANAGGSDGSSGSESDNEGSESENDAAAS